MAQARRDRRHDPVRRDRRRRAVAGLHHHRQDHALQAVGADRRGEERRTGHHGGLDVHRPRHDHPRRGPRLMRLGAPEGGPARVGAGEIALLASVFVVAACGLVYELSAGALASYLLGDSVLQFSTVIGTYLFAMGLGSWLSRYFDRQLPAHFLRIELLVASIGGTLPAVL